MEPPRPFPGPKDYLCRNCGHSPIHHVGIGGSCMDTVCQCTCFSSLNQDRIEAERFYAELKARLDERAPA